MSKVIKTIATIIIMVVMVLICTSTFSGCSEKASKYTEAEHLQRVTRRIEKRFMTDKFEYTGFEVFPLYNEHDELKYFLVEFEPSGFVYVFIRDEQLKAFFYIASTSMYKLSSVSGYTPWQRYTIDETNSQPPPYTDICYEVDEKGEPIYHHRSHFAVAKIKDEKRYVFRSMSAGYHIVAVKRNGEYVNIISMDKVEIVDGEITKKQAVACISSWAKKSHDL